MSELIPSDQDGYGGNCPKCGTEIVTDAPEAQITQRIAGWVTEVSEGRGTDAQKRMEVDLALEELVATLRGDIYESLGVKEE